VGNTICGTRLAFSSVSIAYCPTPLSAFSCFLATAANTGYGVRVASLWGGGIFTDSNKRDDTESHQGLWTERAVEDCYVPPSRTKRWLGCDDAMDSCTLPHPRSVLCRD
jgi:hypothetical protein